MKQILRNAGFYGSTKEAEFAGQPSVESLGPQWQSLGNIRHLFLEVSFAMGKQFVALAMVVFQIYSSGRLLMNCDSRRIGVPLALGCEYTKAYVRCFPLLALVIAVIIASRSILCQRIYYQLLLRDSILGFHSISPAQDPVFCALSFCFVNACLHFLLEMLVEEPLNERTLEKALIKSDEQLHAEIHKVVAFYVLPCIVFMVFLWNAYDLEARLVPLSKYFEADPEEARRILANMQYIEERIAAGVVKLKLLKFQDAEGNGCTINEVSDQLVKQCKRYKYFEAISGNPTSSPVAEANFGNAGASVMRFSSTEALASHDFTDWHSHRVMLQEYSKWYLVSEMWPGKVLLDSRLADEASHNFRYFWTVGCVAFGIILLVVTALLVWRTYDDVIDMTHGQYCDGASLLVDVAHALLALYVGLAFLNKSWGPLLSTRLISQSQLLRQRLD